MSIVTGVTGALGLTHTINSFLLTFGDSYSSTGYDPTSLLQPGTLSAMGNPVYPGVTTSGGPNWVDRLTYDHLPQNYSTFTYNYAYPGAVVDHTLYPAGSYSTSNDFVSEVDSFQTYGPKNFDAARVAALAYWGTNDILIHSGQPNAADNTVLSDAMDSYWAKMEQLYTESVRNFVVFTADRRLLSLRDGSPGGYMLTTRSDRIAVDRIPFASLAEAEYPDYATICKVNRVYWNGLLRKGVAAFKKKHSDAKVATVETGPIFNKILNNPTAYGAPNNYCTNSDGTSCLFWDVVHPGQAIQSAIADGAVAALQRIGFYPK